jgi:branched-subunit amino acid transport protein
LPSACEIVYHVPSLTALIVTVAITGETANSIATISKAFFIKTFLSFLPCGATRPTAFWFSLLKNNLA